MGNGECHMRFEKISAFSHKNWLENYFWQELLQHAAQMKGVPSINAKILAFWKLTVKRGLKNKSFAL